MSQINITNFISVPLKDKKIDANSWMTTMKIVDYLDMIKLKENPYQRPLQQLSFYKKLINDLLNDGVMPAISVVYNSNIDPSNFQLSKDNKFKIIDGLQRTNCLFACLNQLDKSSEGFLIQDKQTFLNKEIYVEIWENIDLKSILYKMVVLNTGQKKMDYAHQLEILSESLEIELKKNHIDYEKSESKNKKNKFLLSDITAGLVSYINRAPISGKKNAAEFLFNKLDIENNNDKDMQLIDSNQTYETIIWALTTFSKILDDNYSKDKNPLLQYDVFLIAFMAALGCVNEKANTSQQIKEIVNEKITFLETISQENDILMLDEYLVYASKFTSGIGDKRRKIIFETFVDFLLTSKNRSSTLEWGNTYDRFFTSK